ncbi:sensor histidine kinase [Yinghuangia soli]|uniref:histidine kinase n=1 Tax=Yinghuangia soli TaxID=2908204 RepID=A0AA41U5U9_9ACTN|nr:histidine kinase [Yinghuangia soli]MCF2532292.1 histidine kinase [Yinghuangia soli]
MPARSRIPARLRTRVRQLTGRRARLRWVHLVLGGALMMPFHLLTTTIVGTAGLVDGTPGSAYTQQLIALALDLPLVAVAGLLPLVRTLEGNAVRVLSDAPGDVRTEPAGTWTARRRTAAWFTLHTALGSVVAAVSLAAPPAGVLLVALPFVPDAGAGLAWMGPAEARPVLGVLAGLILLVLPLPASAAAGAWLARLAPVLLGPTPADRLALAERRAERMAERTRIARELHDSVGHALSAVTLQASAAGRVLDRDPAFAAQALAAIEDTARAAVAELDHVLGLLREEGDVKTAPTPDLSALPDLVARTRAAGADVELDLGPAGLDTAQLPGVVSREAYRVVQEALGNALRHAGAAPVALRVAVASGELEISVANPVTGRTPFTARRRNGGRGLRGAADRVAVLRGEFSAGEHDGRWHLTARIPLGEHT